MKKHLIHLKNSDSTKFAVAEILADVRPGDDLELIQAINDTRGTYITEFKGCTYTLDERAWVSAKEFESTWIGD